MLSSPTVQMKTWGRILQLAIEDSSWWKINCMRIQHKLFPETSSSLSSSQLKNRWSCDTTNPSERLTLGLNRIRILSYFTLGKEGNTWSKHCFVCEFYWQFSTNKRDSLKNQSQKPRDISSGIFYRLRGFFEMMVPKLCDNLCFHWGSFHDAYVAGKQVHVEKKWTKGTNHMVFTLAPS